MSEDHKQQLEQQLWNISNTLRGKMGAYITTFDLYRYNSKNMYYYKVESFGVCEDMFETSGCYAILDNKDDDRVIENFKNDCIEVYNCNGDLDSEELEGSKIEFWN